MKLDEADILKTLRARLPDAMAIYLFGSAASGEAGPKIAGSPGRTPRS